MRPFEGKCVGDLGVRILAFEVENKWYLINRGQINGAMLVLLVQEHTQYHLCLLYLCVR